MKSTAESKRKILTTRTLSLLGLLIAVLIVGGSVLWRTQWIQTGHDLPAGNTSSSLLPQLDEAAHRIAGKPPRAPSAYATGLSVRAAIARGDYALADKTLRASLAGSQVKGWHFNPFAAVIFYAARPGMNGFEARLDEWIKREPNSAIAYLVRALYRYDTAWQIRGTRFVNAVQPAHLRAFNEHLNRSADDVAQAMRLDGNNPYAAFLLLKILSGAGNTVEMENAFQAAIHKFPTYYPLYLQRLTTLEPKWGGSPQAMYAFVDTYAGEAAPDSPLKMLYLRLYADLLSATALVCQDAHADQHAQCIDQGMHSLVTDALEKNVYGVLEMYTPAHNAPFTIEIGGILNDMVLTRGGERYAGALLQLAAHIMGSDNQLTAPDASHNNFMMDRLSGLVWYRQRQYASAEKLYMRTLADLPNTHFDSVVQKDAMRAMLYDALSHVYSQMHRYRESVIYNMAAAQVIGGRSIAGYDNLTCAGLFKLKHYDDAIHACTAQAEDSGSDEALFWRAKAYEATHRIPLALQDYRQLAESESRYRSYAAIEISVIYGHENHLTKMLQALNTYDYLYDEAHEDKMDMASAYNNRCYAEMHLGQLQQALKDCTQSLRFGSLPDAYSKQQELIKKLRTHPQSDGS